VDSQLRQPVQDSGPPPQVRKGCYVCGQANCHSDLHLENPPPPGWHQSQGCRICGQRGCHSDNHQRDPSTPPPRTPPPSRELQRLPPPRQEQGRFAPREGYLGCFRCGCMDCELASMLPQEIHHHHWCRSPTRQMPCQTGSRARVRAIGPRQMHSALAPPWLSQGPRLI